MNCVSGDELRPRGAVTCWQVITKVDEWRVNVNRKSVFIALPAGGECSSTVEGRAF